MGTANKQTFPFYHRRSFQAVWWPSCLSRSKHPRPKRLPARKSPAAQGLIEAIPISPRPTTKATSHDPDHNPAEGEDRTNDNDKAGKPKPRLEMPPLSRWPRSTRPTNRSSSDSHSLRTPTRATSPSLSPLSISNPLLSLWMDLSRTLACCVVRSHGEAHRPHNHSRQHRTSTLKIAVARTPWTRTD